MLGEFKNDQISVEKTKHVSNLYVKIWIISHEISLQQTICGK